MKNAGLNYLLVGLTQERIRKKKSSKLFTRVFLLHFPVFDGQSTVVCSSQGAIDFLVRTIKEVLRIEVLFLFCLRRKRIECNEKNEKNAKIYNA